MGDAGEVLRPAQPSSGGVSYIARTQQHGRYADDDAHGAAWLRSVVGIPGVRLSGFPCGGVQLSSELVSARCGIGIRYRKRRRSQNAVRRARAGTLARPLVVTLLSSFELIGQVVAICFSTRWTISGRMTEQVAAVLMRPTRTTMVTTADLQAQLTQPSAVRVIVGQPHLAFLPEKSPLAFALAPVVPCGYSHHQRLQLFGAFEATLARWSNPRYA